MFIILPWNCFVKPIFSDIFPFHIINFSSHVFPAIFMKKSPPSRGDFFVLKHESHHLVAYHACEPPFGQCGLLEPGLAVVRPHLLQRYHVVAASAVLAVSVTAGTTTAAIIPNITPAIRHRISFFIRTTPLLNHQNYHLLCLSLYKNPRRIRCPAGTMNFLHQPKFGRAFGMKSMGICPPKSWWSMPRTSSCIVRA